MARRKKPKTLRGARANVGITVAYRQRIDKLVANMQNSVEHWLLAAYKANEPAILALDATPAIQLKQAIAALRRRWERNFREAAPELARWFARSVSSRSDRALMATLKKGGFTVEFRMTPAQSDIIAATVQQSVSLIRSIPSQYFTEIEGMVMRSVQTGRDLGTLTKELEARYGVTRRRAALIARDQNNKATSALTRARYTEVGIDEAIWRHSRAGKEPRPKHVKADGTRYKVSEGLPIGDKGQYVHPGEEINCRCYSVPVVPGF